MWLANSVFLLVISTGADGGPRSQVCARLTLHSAPHRQISVRSDQWLLRYSTFNNLRLSSLGGSSFQAILNFWFGLLGLSLKFEDDPISGCRNISLLIF